MGHFNNKIKIIIGLTLMMIFFIDLYVPLGVAVGVLYVFTVLTTLKLNNTKWLYSVTSVSVFLTILALIIKPFDGYAWKTITNRFISIFAIFITAYMGNYVQRQNKILRNFTKVLREKNSMLKEYDFMVAHDLKNPLFGIKSLLNQHSSLTNINEFKFINDKIDKITNEMQSIINTFLNRASTTTFIKDNSTSLEPINIKELIYEIMNQHHDFLKSLVLHVEVDTIWSNKLILKRILANIISNAIKYKKTNTPLVLEIYSKLSDNTIQIQIKDNGIGISQENLPKVFAKNKRIETSQEGHGIGLYTVKELAKDIGAKILVDSSLGIGTTFSISFEVSNALPLTHKNLLIIDDDPEQITLLETLLKREKCYVFKATDEDNAINTINICKIDCVLIDLHLHNKHPITLIKKIQQISNPQIITMSAQLSPKLGQELKNLNITSFLQKPISKERLIKEIWFNR